MTNRTQGDIRFFLTENGVDIDITGGQPVMDRGFTTAVLMSLFTEGSWIGNAFLSPPERFEGNFEKVSKEAITRSMLVRAQAAVKRDLKWMLDTNVAQQIEVRVSAPIHNRLKVVIEIFPPNGAPQTIELSRVGALWTAQYNDPYQEQ